MSSSSKSPGQGLPVELLDIIFANVSPHLPPLLPNPKLDNRHRRGLDDLLRCRLVSKFFSSIASRWVWRRLKLRLMYCRMTFCGPESELACTPDVSRGSFLMRHRVEPLDRGCTHMDPHVSEQGKVSWSIQKATQFKDTCTAMTRMKDITSTVREFSLVVNGRMTLASGDAGAEALRSLEETISRLENLRTVAIYFTEEAWSLTTMVQPITLRLLWKPLLQTVVLSGVDCSLIGAGSQGALKNVKNLCLMRCKGSQDFLSLMPTLEVFGFTRGTRVGALRHPLPWETLREFTVDTTDPRILQSLVMNFYAWELSSSNVESSPLVELVVRYNSKLATSFVTNGFRGLHLRKLCIGKVLDMTIESLVSIVDAFPELEELSVFGERWHGSRTEFARAFGRFANLKSLNWDFFAGRGHREFYYAALLCLGEEGLGPLIRAIKKVSCTPVAARLSDFCPQLRQVTFYDERFRQSDPLRFEIERDRDGQVGPGQAKVRYRGLGPQWQYLSSFWKVERDIRGI